LILTWKRVGSLQVLVNVLGKEKNSSLIPQNLLEIFTNVVHGLGLISIEPL
jgi:hypothetical protein